MYRAKAQGRNSFVFFRNADAAKRDRAAWALAAGRWPMRRLLRAKAAGRLARSPARRS